MRRKKGRTTEEYKRRKARERHKERRLNETPEQRVARQEKSRERYRKRYMQETLKQRAVRLEKCRISYVSEKRRLQLDNSRRGIMQETPEQRAVRLEKGRVYAAQKRRLQLDNMTPEQRVARQVKSRENSRRRIMQETPEQRAIRLEKGRIYVAKKRRLQLDNLQKYGKKENQKEIQWLVARQEKSREISRKRIVQETSEQRAVRLEKNGINVAKKRRLHLEKMRKYWKKESQKEIMRPQVEKSAEKIEGKSERSKEMSSEIERERYLKTIVKRSFDLFRVLKDHTYNKEFIRHLAKSSNLNDPHDLTKHIHGRKKERLRRKLISGEQWATSAKKTHAIDALNVTLKEHSCHEPKSPVLYFEQAADNPIYSEDATISSANQSLHNDSNQTGLVNMLPAKKLAPSVTVQPCLTSKNITSDVSLDMFYKQKPSLNSAHLKLPETVPSPPVLVANPQTKISTEDETNLTSKQSPPFPLTLENVERSSGQKAGISNCRSVSISNSQENVSSTDNNNFVRSSCVDVTCNSLTMNTTSSTSSPKSGRIYKKIDIWSNNDAKDQSIYPKDVSKPSPESFVITTTQRSRISLYLHQKSLQSAEIQTAISNHVQNSKEMINYMKSSLFNHTFSATPPSMNNRKGYCIHERQIPYSTPTPLPKTHDIVSVGSELWKELDSLLALKLSQAVWKQKLICNGDRWEELDNTIARFIFFHYDKFKRKEQLKKAQSHIKWLSNEGSTEVAENIKEVNDLWTSLLVFADMIAVTTERVKSLSFTSVQIRENYSTIYLWWFSICFNALSVTQVKQSPYKFAAIENGLRKVIPLLKRLESAIQYVEPSQNWFEKSIGSNLQTPVMEMPRTQISDTPVVDNQSIQFPQNYHILKDTVQTALPPSDYGGIENRQTESTKHVLSILRSSANLENTEDDNRYPKAASTKIQSLIGKVCDETSFHIDDNLNIAMMAKEILPSNNENQDISKSSEVKGVPTEVLLKSLNSAVECAEPLCKTHEKAISHYIQAPKIKLASAHIWKKSLEYQSTKFQQNNHKPKDSYHSLLPSSNQSRYENKHNEPISQGKLTRPSVHLDNILEKTVFSNAANSATQPIVENICNEKVHQDNAASIFTTAIVTMQRRASGEKQVHECPIPWKQTHIIQTMRKRDPIAYPDFTFDCPVCRAPCNTEPCLLGHLNILHTELSSVTCLLCNSQINKFNLFRHIRSVHISSREKYVCGAEKGGGWKCSFTGSSCSVLYKHIQKNHAGVKHFDCWKCGQVFVSALGLVCHINEKE